MALQETLGHCSGCIERLNVTGAKCLVAAVVKGISRGRYSTVSRNAIHYSDQSCVCPIGIPNEKNNNNKNRRFYPKALISWQGKITFA